MWDSFHLNFIFSCKILTFSVTWRPDTITDRATNDKKYKNEVLNQRYQHQQQQQQLQQQLQRQQYEQQRKRQQQQQKYQYYPEHYDQHQLKNVPQRTQSWSSEGD